MYIYKYYRIKKERRAESRTPSRPRQDREQERTQADQAEKNTKREARKEKTAADRSEGRRRTAETRTSGKGRAKHKPKKERGKASRRRRVHGDIAAPPRSRAKPRPACARLAPPHPWIASGKKGKHVAIIPYNGNRLTARGGWGCFFGGDFPKYFLYCVLPISPCSCSNLAVPTSSCPFFHAIPLLFSFVLRQAHSPLLFNFYAFPSAPTPCSPFHSPTNSVRLSSASFSLIPLVHCFFELFPFSHEIIVQHACKAPKTVL